MGALGEGRKAESAEKPPLPSHPPPVPPGGELLLTPTRQDSPAPRAHARCPPPAPLAVAVGGGAAASVRGACAAA